MGQVSVLNKKQESILAGVRSDRILRESFYFTGGSALAHYYLGHRYSEDLDFFSEEKLDQEYLLWRVKNWSQNWHFKFRARFVEVVYSFFLKFADGVKVKVDFGYYPYPRLEKGRNDKGLSIDSLRDLAVNKLTILSQRTNVKDFVDLYFLLKEKKFTIWDLIYGKETKFKMETEILLLAEDFLKVEDFTFLPRMLKPLSLRDLRLFFRQKAKEVGRKAVEL